MNPVPYGIYVHVPWCRRRCPYCAFYVEVDRDTPWPRFVDAVQAEYRLRKTEFPGVASTVFLGGGTPSRMPGAELERLLGGFDRVPEAEVSIEANPEDVDPAWLEAALRAGVTRISLGIQTLDPRFARLLNRACTVETAERTLRHVAAAGFASWSFDLIFALPGQELADLARDVDRLLELDPPHVSLYGLTIEEGTPFERARDRGSLEPASDERWREMYDFLVEQLRRAGFERYEVSNFARPGHRSRHNTLYWTDHPYLGLGPSAHGYASSGRRWHNVRNVTSYLDGGDPTEASETPTGAARALDLFVSALRTAEGIAVEHVHRTTGFSVDPAVLHALVRAGMLIENPDRIVLSDAGFPLADGIAARLADGLRRVR
jgi:oxygen-independent coproporphyrinogen-3 oxidase